MAKKLSELSPQIELPISQKAKGRAFLKAVELYLFVSRSQKNEKSWIALQGARAKPRHLSLPPHSHGRWCPWKGYPVFILRRWEDISIFSFLHPKIQNKPYVSRTSRGCLADVSRM